MKHVQNRHKQTINNKKAAFNKKQTNKQNTSVCAVFALQQLQTKSKLQLQISKFCRVKEIWGDEVNAEPEGSLLSVVQRPKARGIS